MKYSDFIKITRDISYFKLGNISAFRDNKTLKNQLLYWQRQGKVRMLRRGIYTLNDNERRAPLTTHLASNILYTPSYISLESALAFWGLIPERVTEVTALTPKKTAMFKNFYGTFRYRNIKEDLFFGFVSVKDNAGLPILIAMPEKAILDKIYFDPLFKPDGEYFTENLRLQNYERLSKKRIAEFSKQFTSKKVEAGSSILITLINEERK